MSPWVSTPTMTRVGFGCAMVVMAVSLLDKGGWLAPAGRADNTATGLWRQAPDLLNRGQDARVCSP
jgi:hypothetical protein